MTEATHTKLMDTERGGENTQYESQIYLRSRLLKTRGLLETRQDPPKPLSKKPQNTKRVASERRRILDTERRLVSMGLEGRRREIVWGLGAERIRRRTEDTRRRWVMEGGTSCG
ncbi:uncharacterized protein EAF02_002238 [Botrytis sinoallii]|uniref:uncharacterized protein n=1 Tax=Botrytis sinoallii TaxID=1463999 RepID=UPI0019027674|nr:uncharacterized protein EAF02_002238 [Botrytis sinoallii]KAF7889823.1 hypothetical protein EAF02_002238 [Botrytis sinoallii]